MSKYKSPPPSIRDILEYTRSTVRSPLSIRVAITPGAAEGVCMVSVELVYSYRNGSDAVVRREGEAVRAQDTDRVVGAAYRAAVRLWLWLEGKDQAEVIRLHLWNADRPW